MYHVLYDAPDGVRQYCKQAMDWQTAMEMLALFWENYLGPDGKGKPYPNGEGVYPVSNPRIVKIN